MHKHIRRNSSESIRELRMIDHKVKQNGKINDLRRRMGKMQTAASPAKNEDVIKAFKNKQPLKGRAYSTDGKSFFLFNHEIARHHPKGIEVSHAGFPTAKTYDTLRALGINTRIQKGITTINGNPINPDSDEFHLVPHKDISSSRVYFSTPEQREKQKIRNKESGGIVNQRKFREEGRRRTTGNTKAIPMSPTQIQPHDQKLINSITGLNTPVGKPILAPESHHILFKKQYPGLALNPNNSIPQERNEHDLLHKLNRMSKLKQRLALIEPLILKKKNPRVIRKISVKEAMSDNTRFLSADALADRVSKFIKDNPTWLRFNGTYDPIFNSILDGNIPSHAMRLQEMYGVGNGKIAFNSITDTRNGIQQDVEILRSQLREIEQSGYTPAVGMFNGSLEATRVLSPTTDQEALDDLQEHQRSTAILDANTELRILDNPKFREN